MKTDRSEILTRVDMAVAAVHTLHERPQRSLDQLSTDRVFSGDLAAAILSAIEDGPLWQPITNATAELLYQGTYAHTQPTRHTPHMGPELAWAYLNPGKPLPLEYPRAPAGVSTELSETAAAMIEAGMAFPGAEYAGSPVHPFLQGLATEHARNMARFRAGGHFGFESRFNKVLHRFGLTSRCSEIAARSWHWEAEAPLVEAATSLVKSWRQSDGHWETAGSPHEAIGLEMQQGRNGIWYGVILALN